MNPLDSQVAVVTGAGRGAGEAIACRLAAMGAHVLLVARSADELNRVREHIVQTGGAASAFSCDLMNASAVAKLGTVVAEEHKRCDILVNNAAIGMDGKPLHEVSPDEWDLIFDTNLRGPYALRPGNSLTILLDGFVNRLQDGKFPPHPAIQTTGPGLLPRWDFHPLFMPAFAGRTLFITNLVMGSCIADPATCNCEMGK